MIYTLNKTPVRTSVNYGINDIKLNLNLPQNHNDFNNISFETNELDKIKVDIKPIDNKKINSKIGLEFSKYNMIEIEIPDYVEIKTPIIIDCLFDDDNKVLVDNVIIKMGKNSKANFILYYENEIENEGYFHYLVNKTELDENSEANIIVANLVDDAMSFVAIDNDLKENALLKHTLIDLGGKIKVSNYYSKLEGDKAKNILKNIYLGNKNNIIDINYNIDEIGKNTSCNIESQGALTGSARKNFKGTIDFKKGSSKSLGKENENCLILSNEARSKSLPMLLCHEEDVYGEHGVSSGKPDKAKMFYIMSRGISYSEAEKLLVRANFNNIVKEIDNEQLVNKVNDKIEEMIR